MFRRDPEPIESYCESAACHACRKADDEHGSDGAPPAGLRLRRPTLALTAMGAMGASWFGIGPDGK